jgi:hypothetical protein
MEVKRNSLRSIAFIGLATVLLLTIPLIAMQFTEEVDWKLNDFVIMGALLFGTGLTYELVARKTKRRGLLALVLAGIFFLIWAELAVGVFGTPFAGS